MTSKYQASIKVRLTRVFNIAVVTGVLILATLLTVMILVYEQELLQMTKEELTFLIKFGT